MKQKNRYTYEDLINCGDGELFGKGNEKRDFLFIEDLNRFINILISKQKSNFEIFNCSYGKSYKIKEILEKIIKISKTNKKIITIKNSKNINVDICVDSNKAKKILGWYPKFTINEGLQKTTKWYLENEKFL